MSWLRQSGALCFQRNDRDETVFYFPGPVVVPRRGYIVTSDADAARLKKAPDAYNRTLLWVIVVVVFAGIHLFDAAENFLIGVYHLDIRRRQCQDSPPCQTGCAESAPLSLDRWRANSSRYGFCPQSAQELVS